MQALTEEQKKLVEAHQKLVHDIACKRRVGLPLEVQYGDLVSAGNFGLIDAAQKFDPSRGIRFGAYARTRVIGAISDYLRELDFIPRVARRRTLAMSVLRTRFFMQHGRMPAEGEIEPPRFSGGMGDANDKNDFCVPKTVSLQRKYYESDNGRQTCEEHVLEDERQADLLAAIDRQDFRRHILRNLTRAERLIVILYYVEGMTMKHIGRVLDLSESRVSQMHSSIIERLKATISEAVLS